jgi:hypothetical protein
MISYLKEMQLKLSDQLSAIKKIYLDTKYWIYLREAELGHSDSFNNSQDYKVILNLLNLLKSLRKNNFVICPISTSLFSEIFKNKKEKELKITINLIDELSGGISIKHNDERTFLELLYFLYSKSQSVDICYPASKLVWTKLSLALGSFPPINLPCSQAQELVIRKAFLDQLWASRLQDIFETMGMQNIINMPEMDNISIDLNTDKIKYAEDYSTFDELFNIELIGTLQALNPIIVKSLRAFNVGIGGTSISDEAIENSEEKKVFVSLLYQSVKTNKSREELPSIYIPAAIHTAIRWDKYRKYKANESYDFLHAECALPYFDFFLTENSLKELITKKSHGFGEIYNCCVIADPVDAFNELLKLSTLQNPVNGS